jgi:hypothetical protein
VLDSRLHEHQATVDAAAVAEVRDLLLLSIDPSKWVVGVRRTLLPQVHPAYEA